MEKQFIGFSVAGYKFCIDIMIVQEVVKDNNVTHFPDVPFYIEGVVNLRSNIVPVFSIEKKIGLYKYEREPEEEKEVSRGSNLFSSDEIRLIQQHEERIKEDMNYLTGIRKLKKIRQQKKQEKRLIIAKLQDYTIAFVVDELEEVFTEKSEDINSSEGVTAISREFIQGYIQKNNEMYFILNARALLNAEDKKIINQML